MASIIKLRREGFVHRWYLTCLSFLDKEPPAHENLCRLVRIIVFVSLGWLILVGVGISILAILPIAKWGLMNYVIGVGILLIIGEIIYGLAIAAKKLDAKMKEVLSEPPPPTPEIVIVVKEWLKALKDRICPFVEFVEKPR